MRFFNRCPVLDHVRALDPWAALQEIKFARLQIGSAIGSIATSAATMGAINYGLVQSRDTYTQTADILVGGGLMNSALLAMMSYAVTSINHAYDRIDLAQTDIMVAELDALNRLPAFDDFA